MPEVDVAGLLEYSKDLLGARITFDGITVRLTEVEAYAGSVDPGSHSFRGRTKRNEVMFGPPHHLYVYFTYGMHHCMNIVHGEVGSPSAVLLRAGEVVDGLEKARDRRPHLRDRDLARGPARLAKLWGITLDHNGIQLGDSRAGMSLEGLGSVPREVVARGPRVGVAGEGGDGERFPWRFWIEGDPTVSTYRPAKSRKRANSS